MGSLGMLDSPSSPNPNLSRTSSMPPTPGRRSPSKGIPFPVANTSPSKAATSAISALGISSSPDEDAMQRAKRELSVIDERGASEIQLRNEEDADEGDQPNGPEEAPGDLTTVDRSDSSASSSPNETGHRRMESSASRMSEQE